MEDNHKILEYIVKCIEETGCNPRDQITAYISTRDERYITRYGDARRAIKSVAYSELVNLRPQKILCNRQSMTV